MDHHEGTRLTRAGQRADARKSGFAARTPLAVAVDVGGNLAVDAVAVLQCLLGFGDADGAVRRIGDDFAWVHFAEAENFHPRSGETGWQGKIRRGRRFRRWFLSFQRVDAEKERPSQYDLSLRALHSAFSSSLLHWGTRAARKSI